MKKLLTYIPLMLTLLAVKPAFAQKSLSTYYLQDSRDYHGLTITWLDKELPFGLETSGFTDINSKPGSRDISTQYLEPRISRTNFFKKEDNLVNKILNGFGVIAEGNITSGENNDKYRFGFFSNNNIKGVIANIKYLPYNSKQGQQISIFLKKSGKDWYVNGFIDYNIIDGKNKVLSEFWGGHKISDNLYGILELRLNQFLKENQKGIAVGLEYKF